MDTSEQYINMCRKATELQEMWDPEVGDFHKKPLDKYTYIVDKVTMNKEGCIWLPRIDQLIALSKLEWNEFLYTVVEYGRADNSVEISGLCELMSILYDKGWNGEDWI